MRRYLPLLALRLSLALVFFYFGYQALVHPASQLAYISPALEKLSPLPLSTVILLIGLAEVAAALAFALGVWFTAAGTGGAILLGVIISSIGLMNEIGFRDLVILASCLVVAGSDHKLALQPTFKRIKLPRLIIFFIVLIACYVWLLS